MTQERIESYLNCFRAILPANTGDLLWLIERFLAEKYPNRCELDLAAGSEVGTSVYHVIAAFCSKDMYKNHPRCCNMLALTNIVEQGGDERVLVVNTLFCVCSVLRVLCEEKEESGAFDVGGETRCILRFGLVVRPATSKSASAVEGGNCCSIQEQKSYSGALICWHWIPLEITALQ